MARRIVLGIVLLLCIAGITFDRFPGSVLLFARLESRTQACSLWKTIVDAPVFAANRAAARRIAAQSALLRRDGTLDLWDTPEGEFWVPTGSPGLLPILLAQQERDIYGGADLGVQPGDIVLDCGAHVGVYTRRAIDVGAALVVAIEPSQDAVQCLRRNLAEEIADGRVIVYPKGVWDRDDILSFWINGNADAGNSFVVQTPMATEVQVPVVSIDTLVEDLQLPRVDFIKADIKGASERMIVGARETIKRHHPRLAISTEEPPEDPLSVGST